MYLSIQNFLKRLVAKEYIRYGGKGQCYVMQITTGQPSIT
jgi:hypothetical protein